MGRACFGEVSVWEEGQSGGHWTAGDSAGKAGVKPQGAESGSGGGGVPAQAALSYLSGRASIRVSVKGQ